jgi:hypothetical protein
VNAIFNSSGEFLKALFAILLRPLSALDPTYALIFISALFGILMVFIFGRISSQDRIFGVKNRIRGNLLGVRLFRHDLGVVFKLQCVILRDTLRYLTLTGVPLLLLTVPTVLILGELNLYFGSAPLPVDMATIVTFKIEDRSGSLPQVSMEASKGVVVESPPVRAPSRGEISWRIRAIQSGLETLTFQIGDRKLYKEVRTGKEWVATSSYRTASVLKWLLSPGEALLDDAEGVVLIEVRHPSLKLSMWGYSLNWVALFLFTSILTGFGFKKSLGVEI